MNKFSSIDTWWITWIDSDTVCEGFSVIGWDVPVTKALTCRETFQRNTFSQTANFDHHVGYTNNAFIY